MLRITRAARVAGSNGILYALDMRWWFGNRLLTTKSKVEGQENPPNVIVGFKFYEVQKYLATTGHMTVTLSIMTNNRWFHIGTITPPVGMIMYVVCGIGKISALEFSREIWPFVVALVVALALVTFIPEITMWLPDLLLPAR